MAEDNTTPTGLPFSNPATSMRGVHGGRATASHLRSGSIEGLDGIINNADSSPSNPDNSYINEGANGHSGSVVKSTASAARPSASSGQLRPSSSNSSISAAVAAGQTSTNTSNTMTTSSQQRPPNPRTRSSSSISSLRSATSSSNTATTTSNPSKIPALAAASSSNPANASSPAASINSNSTKNAVREDEIEASLRQWRNHVFPSLKAGNYISPGQETPDKDPIHPLVEPILPSIFKSLKSNNSKCIPVVYANGKQFLDAVIGSNSNTLSRDTNGEKDEDENKEDYESNWRLEMVLGQTKDLIVNNENAEGIWIAVWSGSEATKTRLLEFCLMKLPSRPLVLSSPIPISLLPTALLQDRMQTLLNTFLSLPSVKANPSPFSLMMGPSRVVEAFLLHYDSHPGLLTTANIVPSSSSSSSSTSNGAQGGTTTLGNTTEGMFEQSVLQSDQSPYPLKLSHPKYTAAMQQEAANADSSSSDLRARSGSASASNRTGTTPPSISSLSSSSSLTSIVPGGASTQKQQQETSESGLAPPSGAASSASANQHIMKPYQNSNIVTTTTNNNHRQLFHHSAAAGRTVKPLLHTRAKDIPPAVSLSEGFAVRLAEEKDDPRKLVSLFQAYSQTLDHILEENAARRALQKAMANKSVWIYHIYSQSLPGLSLIAGFLTTERRRPYSGSNVRSKADGGTGKGSVAITAVFTEESYRSRGVAESLVRTATRYYLVDLEYDYVSVYVDPRNETTCRVFSRVGYGIMDREVNEDIPVKLIRDALHIQWEEEKEKYQAMLEHLASQGTHQLQLHDKEQSFDSANGSLLPATPTTSQSLLTARNTLSLLTAANKEVSSAIEESSPTTAHAESGNLIPTAEENEAALQAENGKPLCTSSEEWQVVSLRSREVALVETRSRARGHARRDDSKRLSSEGPWH